MPPLITVESISFHYPQTQGIPSTALQAISFEIHKGEFVAILGANGSGKTTLARHLNGLLLPERGRVLVAGLDTSERKNHGLIRQRIGMVFQHPEDQIVATTVEEDVAFGPENLGLPAAIIRSRVDEAIQAVGLQAHRLRSPHLLSAGQMQRLALAGVLAMRPSCVVFDEATTMLDPAGRRMALELMNGLCRDGLAVLFVTHNMDEAALASRVLILHAGRLVFDGRPEDAFLTNGSEPSGLGAYGLEPPPALSISRRISRWLPGFSGGQLTMEGLLEALPPPPSGVRAVHSLAQTGPGSPVLEVQGLEHTYLEGTPLAHVALSEANLAVYPGRAHGLAGVTGSGKSTLLQHLNGLLRPQKGSVRLGKLYLENPAVGIREIVRLAGLVFQNPESQFFETYVGDEIAYGPRQLGLEGAVRDHVRWAMEMVGLDFETFKDRPVYALSGGERRKVALASVLANRPRFLLLDEPTAGLDPASHREILGRLSQLQTEGAELVVSSHRMDDLAELAQDLTVFRKGKSLFTGPVEDFFGRDEELVEAGLEAPSGARVANRLRALGWPLPTGIVSLHRLETTLAECQERGV